eukprot:scaffold25607_cov142-Cylindrotheca_fusiformis.AAC.1
MNEAESRPSRRGSLLGSGGGSRRRGSLFGNGGGGEEEEQQGSRTRRRGSMFGNNGGSRRRGSFFGNKANADGQRPLRRTRRASVMAGAEQAPLETSEPQPRRGSLGRFSRRGSTGNRPRRGSMGSRRGSMGNRPRRGSAGFFHRGKERNHQESSEDLAYQVMAAFANFEE